MDQKALDLYEKYTEGSLNRREFLKKLATLAGSAAAAVSLLPILEDHYAKAQFVPENDSRLETGYVNYPVEWGEMRAYSARPKEEKKHPGEDTLISKKPLEIILPMEKLFSILDGK